MVTAPRWCLIISSRKSRSNAAPSASARLAISSAVSMPGMGWKPSAWCASTAVTSWPRSRSQSCIISISSSCESSMRSAVARMASLAVLVSRSAVISRAWAWCEIMPCHEPHVGLAEPDAREVGGLVGRDGPARLAGGAGLHDGGLCRGRRRAERQERHAGGEGRGNERARAVLSGHEIVSTDLGRSVFQEVTFILHVIAGARQDPSASPPARPALLDAPARLRRVVAERLRRRRQLCRQRRVGIHPPARSSRADSAARRSAPSVSLRSSWSR